VGESFWKIASGVDLQAWVIRNFDEALGRPGRSSVEPHCGGRVPEMVVQTRDY